MGSTASQEKENNQIKDDFETSPFAKHNDFFGRTSQLLKDAEKIIEGLIHNRETADQITTTHLLKDYKYVNNIEILFWTLSAEANGKIADTNVAVMNGSPYITLEEENVSTDAYGLYRFIAGYINTVTNGPETLRDIIAKLEEDSKFLSKNHGEARAEIHSSNLGFREKARAIAALEKNSSRLSKELKKCQELSELLKQADADLKEWVPRLADLLAKADEIGAKAAAENVKKPAEIFDRFHTGARKFENTKADKKEEKKANKKEEKKTELKQPLLDLTNEHGTSLQHA